MATLGIEREIVDHAVYERAVEHLARARVLLPTFAQLEQPHTIPDGIRHRLAEIDPDAPHPLNLFRVHWWNDTSRRDMATVPDHLLLPPQLTGIRAPILIVLGNRFPMIQAHKVLATYGCLAPRIVTGQFDPARHRAVWPSTGNYCRGGVAVSRIMGCRGVAVLPEGMSGERFRWLEQWVTDPADIVKTPGTESNVKEIYDRCAVLERDPQNVILNQFSEFGNHLAHYSATGTAVARVFEAAREQHPEWRLAAFVSATGSAGTIGAGDRLKDRYGCRIVAAEALECPTMLENGYGEHNIQGIGDKHIPLIHNVMNTDVVVAISDRATDALGVVFASRAGRDFLRRRGVPDAVVAGLDDLGLSSICNVLASIRTARRLDLGPDDVIATVATDGADMYATEREKTLALRFPRGIDAGAAAEAFEHHVLAHDVANVLVLGDVERRRIFNLGYYTWVEQQGVPLSEFEARREQAFWKGLRALLPAWDEMIGEFNARTGAAPD